MLTMVAWSVIRDKCLGEHSRSRFKMRPVGTWATFASHPQPHMENNNTSPDLNLRCTRPLLFSEESSGVGRHFSSAQDVHVLYMSKGHKTGRHQHLHCGLTFRIENIRSTGDQLTPPRWRSVWSRSGVSWWAFWDGSSWPAPWPWRAGRSPQSGAWGALPSSRWPGTGPACGDPVSQTQPLSATVTTTPCSGLLKVGDALSSLSNKHFSRGLRWCIFASPGSIQIVRGLLMSALSLGMLGFVLSLLGMECTFIGGKDRSKYKKIYAGGWCHIVSGNV